MPTASSRWVARGCAAAALQHSLLGFPLRQHSLLGFPLAQRGSTRQLKAVVHIFSAPWDAAVGCNRACRAPAICTQVRAWFGIPQRPDATGLDSFNQLAAALFFCYAAWIGLTGRKV